MVSETRRTCLYVNNSPEPGRGSQAKLGGGGKSLLSILKELPQAGWKPYVVVPAEGPFTDVLRDLGVAHEIFPYTSPALHHPLETLRCFMRWRRIIGKVQPAIIHANGFETSRSFALAAVSMRTPFVSHVRFPVAPDGIRWVLRRLPKPAGFIFNSHALRNRMWPTISDVAPHAKNFIVHNAVDLDSFTPAPWPEGPPYRVGIIANFAPFKRHEDFLRMAAEMVMVRQDLEFWIVGDDTEGSGRRRVLEQLAEELGVTGYTRFLGHRSDIPDIMRQLHLLVVPSQFEPFGRVVIEAMACGRPVVASRDGGIPEIIEDGETGHLIEVGDCTGFARAALDLLGQRERWEIMSRRAVETAQARFSIPAHVARITEIYREIELEAFYSSR